MKFLYIILLILFTLINCDAQIPVGYYDSAIGKEGKSLRQALHDIIKNHTIIPYTSTAFDATDAIKVLDQDLIETNKVTLIYSGFTDYKTNFGNPGVEKEHMWPNSYGIDSIQPSYSDLFNLRAIDSNVNSSRGNKYYDISDTNNANYRFPAHIEAPLCSTDIDSWQPRVVERGDIARAVFYMDVRYEGDHVNEPNLTLTDKTNLVNSSTNLMGKLSTLLKWNEEDVVASVEQIRNDKIYNLYQHNRNPFVDHPEWVNLVFRPTIHIKLLTNSVKVYWGNEWTNSILETSVNVIGTWSTYSGTITNNGTNFETIVSITNPYSFFRLKDFP